MRRIILTLVAMAMIHLPPALAVDIDNQVRGVKAMPAGIPVPADGTLRTQLMEVFVRHGDRWWIEAYHNVDTKPSN